MSRLLFLAFLLAVLPGSLFGQPSFNYAVALNPVSIPNLPGLHSYAFGQHNGKWLVIGGRKDGIHARQPNSAFPQAQNNTSIYVIDVNSRQFWSASVTTLPTGLKEQLQSTNMNFYQDGGTLYISGGYAFSATANDHITFPNLTAVDVAATINAVITAAPIAPYFKQLTDPVFALTGGQLGKIGNTFYLVGGHRFDGRYNPMGNPTFTQTYSNQIRKFTLNNSGTQLSYGNYSAITDPIHLRRRDYNLLPQIFPDGTPGYTISSGVFQLNADLPFLYPVDITAAGHTPVTTFNQYLSNYHSAKACLYDSLNNQMHTLFFGGLSQYYYQNGALVQDNQVPFVKTISRLTRFSDGTLQEFQLPIEMPALKGAGAEFFPNPALPHYPSEIVKLSAQLPDTILIGHIYGGILSPSLNPFAGNLASTTSADPTVYAVTLIRNQPAGEQEIDGKNPYTLNVYPNPVSSQFTFEINLDKPVETRYFVTNAAGQIINQGQLKAPRAGLNKEQIKLEKRMAPQPLFLTVVVENKYYMTRKLLRK